VQSAPTCRVYRFKRSQLNVRASQLNVGIRREHHNTKEARRESFQPNGSRGILTSSNVLSHNHRDNQVETLHKKSQGLRTAGRHETRRRVSSSRFAKFYSKSREILRQSLSGTIYQRSHTSYGHNWSLWLWSTFDWTRAKVSQSTANR